MATQRPGDIPNWADNPTPDSPLIKPVSGLRDQGWSFGQRPPEASVNWSWNDFARWAAHQASGSSVFSTLQQATNPPVDATPGSAAPLNVGDSCFIDEDDGAGLVTNPLPGDVVVASMDSAITSVGVVDSGGQGVLLGGTDGVNIRLRLVERDGSALIREFTFTNALNTIQMALNDGVDVIACYSDGITPTVECWDATTGASKWVVNPLGAVATAVQDAAWDDSQIYIVSGTLNNELKALDRTTGATNWTFNHAAQLESVCANGRLVFVQGFASTLASLATLRGIVAINGFDATGEGGLGMDAFLAWDRIQAVPAVSDETLATDGKILYSTSGVAPALLELRGCSNGALTVSKNLPDQLTHLVVDQDYVFTVDGSSDLLVHDKRTLAEAWRRDASGSVYTDGTALFERGSGGARLARGNERPTMFRRVDPSAESWLSLRQLLVPVSRG